MSYAFDTTAAAEFGDWLRLNLESLAWEGKHRASFDEFWHSVFGVGAEVPEIAERIRHARKIARTGPLYSWLGWLQDRFLVFTFARSGAPLDEFCRVTDTEESWLCHVLRDYFMSVVPEHEDDIHAALEAGNRLSPNRQQTFAEIAARSASPGLPRHGDEDDMMLSLEITLFPQWGAVTKEMKKDVQKLRLDWDRTKARLSWRKQWRFVREVALLMVVATVLIAGMRQANDWWESSIVKKIKLLEPTFFGLDLSLSYRPEDRAQRKIELSNEEIEKLERIEDAQSFEEIKDVRFDPESDEVALTSVEEIPAFAEGEGQRSEYEERERSKGGYRDLGAGGGGVSRAYRVLMTSVDGPQLRAKILPLLGTHGATPVGNVRPGTDIPGGLYFNLLVPSSKLRGFLGEVSATGDATIFESNAREATPAGKSRVFIWVKTI
jgi:hypothetical protein